MIKKLNKKTIRLELNTEMIRLFNGCYDSIWDVREYDDDGQELEIEYNFEDLMKSIIQAYQEKEDDILYDLDIHFIKSIHFNGKYDSPKYYNYSNDSINFDIEIDRPKLLKKLKELDNDEFKTYLNEHFTDYDGFISFTPNNYPEIMDSIQKGSNNIEQSISAVISYLAGEDERSTIQDGVYDYWEGQGYMGLDYQIINSDEK